MIKLNFSEWRPASACAILLLVAPLFALATWQTSYSFSIWRHLSVPVLAAEVLIIFLAIHSGFSIRAAFHRIDRLTRHATIAWLTVIGAATLMANSQPAMAWVLLVSTLIHALFVLAFWERFSGEWREWRLRFAIALAIGATIYFAVILALAYGQRNNPDFNWVNFGPGVSHVRQLGFYGLCLSGIAAGLLAGARDITTRLACASLLVLGTWLILLSGGRAAFGAMIIAFALVISQAGKRRHARLALTILACFALAVPLSYSFVPDARWGFDRIIDKSIGDVSKHEFTSGRLEIWRETLAAIHDRPMIGHGEGQFRYSIARAHQIYNHPHNALLQFLFQWGLLGTSALATMLYRTFASLPTALRHDRALALPALGAGTGLFAMATLEGSLYHPYPVMIVLFSLATIASIGTVHAAASVPHGREEKTWDG